MISPEQADSFLTNILKFPNWRQVLDKDKLEFLQRLLEHYGHHVPFQNIFMCAEPQETRRVPTEQDIVDAVLSGDGGACITLNGFLPILLNAVGFNAYVISCSVLVPGTPSDDNHVLCVVELDSTQKYVLESGVGLPIAGPVPIHQLPFGGRGCGYPYQYKEDPEKKGTYQRVQLEGSLYGAPFGPKDTVFVRYDFTMVRRTLEFFEKPLHDIFTNPDASILLQRPTLFRYFEEDEDTGELLDNVNVSGDRKWILIRGCSVLIGTNETINLKHHKTYDDLKGTIHKYFPRLTLEQVRKAFVRFNESAAKRGFFVGS